MADQTTQLPLVPHLVVEGAVDALEFTARLSVRPKPCVCLRTASA